MCWPLFSYSLPKRIFLSHPTSSALYVLHTYIHSWLLEAGTAAVGGISALRKRCCWGHLSSHHRESTEQRTDLSTFCTWLQGRFGFRTCNCRIWNKAYKKYICQQRKTRILLCNQPCRRFSSAKTEIQMQRGQYERISSSAIVLKRSMGRPLLSLYDDSVSMSTTDFTALG